MRQKSRSASEAVLLAAVASALAPVQTASADIEGAWQEAAPGLIKFTYQVSNLPDFDQVRASLPNCGLNYCVPTTTADLLAYIANHGFPEVPPGPGAWMTPGKYNDASNLISMLGQKMDTDPFDGTVKSNWYYALAGAPQIGIQGLLPPSKFTVWTMFGSSNGTPRMYKAAESAIWSNGLLALCHGWYESNVCFDERMDTRDGGHCLAVVAIDGWLHQEAGVGYADYGAKVVLHDPGSDEGSDGSGPCDGAFKPTSQSPAQENAYKLWLRDLWVPFHCSKVLMLDRLYTCEGPGCIDTNFRLADAYLMIATKSAYSFSTDPDPVLYHLKPIQFVNARQQPAVQNLGAIQGAASASLDADGGAIYVVSNGTIRVVCPLRASIANLPAGDYQMLEPVALVVSRRRSLYVVEGGNLECIDVDWPEPFATALVTPPVPPSGVLADEAADEVVVLSQSAHAIARYAWHLQSPPSVVALPADVPLDANTTAAIDPTSGAIWLNNGGPTMHRVFAGRGSSSQAFTLPAVQLPVQGFDVDDAGHLLVSVGGLLREYLVAGATLVEVGDSPFRNLPGGRIVMVTHSRTNFDPAVHGGPGWFDSPPHTFAPVEPTCGADLDGDGNVGPSDLALMLGSWGDLGGPADLDGDSLVGPADLARLLGNWGPCPPPPAAVPILSDECGSATLVGEEDIAFDTTFASDNDPPLPASCNEGSGLSIGKDVWALYLPALSGTATISTCGSANFDTRLAVYGGFCGDLTLLACNDDACGSLQSSVAVPATAGVPLLVRLGGFAGASGQGTLHIGLAPYLDADACGDAPTVGEGSFGFDTSGATVDGPPLPATCEEGSGLAFGPDVWTRYIPSVSGMATVSTCGAADYDTRLAAYLGTCGALAIVGCNDDASGCAGFSSKMSFPVTAGTPVLIRIGGFGSAIGSGTVTISLP